MRSKRPLFAIRWIVVFLCALSWRTAQCEIKYVVTNLGTLGGTTSTGLGINASGQVVGYSYLPGNTVSRAFLWTPDTPNGPAGTIQDLGTLGGPGSNATAINDVGQVVGTLTFSGNPYNRAFLWTPLVANGTIGTMQELGTLGGNNSGASSINAMGVVTGSAQTSAGAHGTFVWTPSEPNATSGAMQYLGTLGGTHSFAGEINDAGIVAGSAQVPGDGNPHAFIYDGMMHDIGTLGGTSGVPRAINSLARVVGEAETADGEIHAFLYDDAMHDLGTLGGTFSGATGINSRGQIVGGSFFKGDANGAAFLFSAETGMVNLNSLIEPASGWELGGAYAINDAGQITGTGLIDGEYHAFLLTPLPEPSSCSMLLSVVLTALLKRRLSLKVNQAAVTRLCD